MTPQVQEIIQLVKSMDNHTALWGPTHVIFEDYNLSRKLFNDKRYHSDDEWLEYIRNECLQRTFIEVLIEIEAVFDTLYVLGLYNDAEIDAAQEALIGD